MMIEKIGYILLGCFLLLLPGFMLTLVLFPKQGLDFWSRIALSVGFGAMALIYIGVVLGRPELRMLRFAPFMGAVLLFSAACGAIAHFRGGLKIPAAYARAAMRVLRRPKPPQPPPPPQAQPPAEQRQLEEPKPGEAPRPAPQQAPGEKSTGGRDV